jgi:hypothetical protein
MRAGMMNGTCTLGFRHHADRAFQGIESLFHLLDLLVREVGIDPAMAVGVVRDLVAFAQDHLDAAGVVRRRPARHEERAPHSGLLQHFKDLRHRHLGAIGALAQRARPLGVRRIARQPQRLGVEIEGEHHGNARAVRSVDAHVDHRSGVLSIRAKQVSFGWPTDAGCDSVFGLIRGGRTWLVNLR